MIFFSISESDICLLLFFLCIRCLKIITYLTLSFSLFHSFSFFIYRLSVYFFSFSLSHSLLTTPSKQEGDEDLVRPTQLSRSEDIHFNSRSRLTGLPHTWILVVPRTLSSLILCGHRNLIQSAAAGNNNEDPMMIAMILRLTEQQNGN